MLIKTMITFLLNVLISCRISDALSCYVCNSSQDISCLEKITPDDSPLRPEPCNVADAKFCIKTTGIYGGFVGVNRFCSAFDMGWQCDIVSFPDHDRIYRACVYTCFHDGCNSSYRSHSNRMPLALFVLFTNLIRILLHCLA